MKTKQFSGVTKPRPFFDRKVRKEGDTRVISIGKVIPKNWVYVRIRKTMETDTSVTLRITKLLGDNSRAQTKTVNKADRQNT